MANFTYDLSTTIGKVRLLIGDTDNTDFIFKDSELQSLADMVSGPVELVAARAYGVLIRSSALLSKKVRRDGYESEAHALADLRQLQKDLIDEASAASGGLQVSEFAINDEHFEAFRPGWVDAIDATVQ